MNEQIIALIAIVLLTGASILGWHWFITRVIYHYSGVEFICRKLIPAKQEQKHLPTLPLWLIGIYVAFFGLASQRFENRVDIIERKADVINTQLTPVIKEISIQKSIISVLEKLKERPRLEEDLTIETGKLEELQEIKRTILSKIPAIQNYPCPVIPSVLKPQKTIFSLFTNSVHKESVDELKALIEDAKYNLKDADLWGANLQGADLSKANLQGADLMDANLQGAYLWRANFQGANLMGAKLEGADLMDANLQGADLIDANLQGADLMEANLQGTKLMGANLMGANLMEAKLEGAYLTGANLQGAAYLTVKQLSNVETLYKAKLDPELMTQVKEKHPHLLENPKPEEEKTDDVQ